MSAFGNIKLCLTDQDVGLENKDSERKNVGCLQYCHNGIKVNLLYSSNINLSLRRYSLSLTGHVKNLTLSTARIIILRDWRLIFIKKLFK